MSTVKVYNTQPFKIELTYTTLPATPASQQICYRTPRGVVGHFDASLDTVNLMLYYWSAVDETLEISGVWQFWSKIIDANDQEYPGEAINYIIYPEGQ
jgi:hypothetical protein